ncbi:RAVE subunit 2/Rogdi [Pseudomassariella vexata]|uniref:RAVE subunit 2/Rogdi n=1 Tax=Pseudomassariella vexata TaxID=1141098 RepID=A0A1Y2D6G8_9PEZI|nr:RAVE subunit 2/Rogdi [Pseudomassariella vexata]ORY54744.1 RAVE subunit 2/Rogdi [Pseudomassariella vexata]
MSVAIWPPIAPEQLKIEEDATQARELNWLLTNLHTTLRTLKTSLEETYALLAPIDPGSTLVVSTPRHETVKGHITRVGTRLIKGNIAVKLRTQPPFTLTLDAAHVVHVPELTTLNTLLTQSIDLLALCVSERPDPRFLRDQLRLLADYLSEAVGLVKGKEPGEGSQADTRWTSCSVPPECFNPPLDGSMSVYFTLQDAALVMYLRALEPADAPVNFGTKLALAIGTARRLEHDEADRVFGYCPEGLDEGAGSVSRERAPAGARGGGMGKGRGTEIQVFVREKVRIESADPSLMSLSSKLGALGSVLALARRNLAVVMGEDVELE